MTYQHLAHIRDTIIIQTKKRNIILPVFDSSPYIHSAVVAINFEININSNNTANFFKTWKKCLPEDGDAAKRSSSFSNRSSQGVVNHGDIETPFIHFLFCFSLLGLYSIFVGVVCSVNSDGHFFEF